MKETYIAPNAGLEILGSMHMLASSGIISDRGIRYGGIDEGGDLDPDARQDNNYWDNSHWDE